MNTCPHCGSTTTEPIGEWDAIKPCYGAISTTVRWIRCTNCQLVRRENPPTREQLQRFYEADGEHEEPPAGGALHNRLVLNDRLWQRVCGVIRDLHRAPCPCTVLEIGSAWGEFCSVLEYSGLWSIGLEVSKRRAEWAERMLGVGTLVGDAVDRLSTDIKTQYDAVAMWEVLEHFPNPGQVLKLTRAAVNPRWLLLSTPCLDHPYHRAMGDDDPMWGVPEHLVYFDRKTLAAVLDAAGFEITAGWFSAAQLGCTRWVARVK